MRIAPILALSLLATPALATATLALDSDVSTAATTPPHTLQAGDIGTPTLHTSGTGASVALAQFPLLGGTDDILKVASTNASWQIHAEMVSQSGWTGLLESITISLWDGTTQDQIQISQLGGVQQTSGADTDLPTGTPAELRVSGIGTGSVDLDLVLTQDGTTNPTLRYRVSLTVG